MRPVAMVRRALGSVDPRIVDGVIAVALAIVACTELAIRADEPGVTPRDVRLTVVFLLVETVPLTFRRQRPFLVLNVVGIAALGFDLAQIPPDPSTAVFAVLLALYSASAYAERPLDLVAGGVGLAGLVVVNLPAIAGEQDFQDIANQVVLLSGAWVVGQLTRARRHELELLRDRAERAEREREERARLAAMEERAQIARELHDVIAHSVSVIAVQAGAARTVGGADPDAMREALAAIETVSRETMEELRRALGVLAAPNGSPRLAPAPGLDAIGDLVRRVEGAGLEVRLTVEDCPGPVPAGVGLSAYRVVQEALTNVLRHAGPTSVEVTIRPDRGWLDVTIVDVGARDRRPAVTPGGHGLEGLRQRVEALGGTVTAGAQDNGFAVCARFPIMPGGPA